MRDRNVDEELAKAVQQASASSAEFGQLAQMFGAGLNPDKGRARMLGLEMQRQGAAMKEILDAMEFSDDFQAMETNFFLNVQANRLGTPSMRTAQLVLSWQGDGMVAYSEGRGLPPPPPGVDIDALSQSARTAGGPGKPPRGVRIESMMDHALPFRDEDFDSVAGPAAASVKRDYERLVRDHQKLVGLGDTYKSFDTAGREFYLDQMALMHFRWEELIAAALRAGVSFSPSFKALSKDYLERSDLTAAKFRGLLDGVLEHFRQRVAQEKLGR